MVTHLQLPNGLTVICEERPKTGKVAMKVSFKAGSIHESTDENGLTSLMQESCWGGTATRSRNQIANDIESRGGRFSSGPAATPNARHATATAPWMRAINRVRLSLSRYRQRNTARRARRNVQHHYDLSGSLYELFLDSDRQYSCAYYREPQMTLEEAQQAKKEHIAAKLYLNKPSLSVLDIGSGWGGLGLHLARNFNADVTGITLSEEQLAYANQRIQPREEHRVRFLLKDFRALDDRFDRIVSVGMFEHVGRPHYDTFFRQCAKLLKQDGVMLLHSIGRSDVPSWTNPFIDRYIFPGGYTPSLSEVLPAIERSGLKVMDMEILRLHYADTLRDWRARFTAQREKAKALYDETFCRMWEFYLAAAESAFRWQNLMVFQVQLAHHHEAVPLTRDYINDCERHFLDARATRRAG